MVIDFELVEEAPQTPASVGCTARVETTGQTGVEMEALMAVQVALLTIYDMCKAVDRGMVLAHTDLREKSGGNSGLYVSERSAATK